MKTIESIDIAALETVTGGVHSPCPAIRATPFGELSKKDIAMGFAQCQVPQPSKKMIDAAKQIRY